MSEEKDVKAVLKYLIAPDADCHLDKKQLVQLLHDWDTLRARANNPRILPLRQFAIARSVFLVVCIVTSYNKKCCTDAFQLKARSMPHLRQPSYTG